MLNEIDDFYLNSIEPNKSCFMALRNIILGLDKDIKPAWKYKMPFFTYKGKIFCYFWTDKKTSQPYIGIAEGNKINHPALEQGNRIRMKILRIDPNEDLLVKTIIFILKKALTFYI